MDPFLDFDENDSDDLELASALLICAVEPGDPEIEGSGPPQHAPKAERPPDAEGDPPPPMQDDAPQSDGLPLEFETDIGIDVPRYDRNRMSPRDVADHERGIHYAHEVLTQALELLHGRSFSESPFRLRAPALTRAQRRVIRVESAAHARRCKARKAILRRREAGVSDGS